MAGRLPFVPITRTAESYRPNAFVTMIWSECLFSTVSTRGQKQQPWISHRPGGRRREGEEDCGAPRCGLHPHHHLPAGAGGHSHLLEVSAPAYTHTHTKSVFLCRPPDIEKFPRVTETVSSRRASTRMKALRPKSCLPRRPPCCWLQVSHTPHTTRHYIIITNPGLNVPFRLQTVTSRWRWSSLWSTSWSCTPPTPSPKSLRCVRHLPSKPPWRWKSHICNFPRDVFSEVFFNASFILRLTSRSFWKMPLSGQMTATAVFLCLLLTMAALHSVDCQWRWTDWHPLVFPNTCFEA